MTAIILAGGQSSRMGLDKAFIKFKGLSLIGRQLKLLRSIFEKIIIVTNNPGKYKFKAIKVVKDIIPGCGPLSGIHAGLTASDSFYNFVIACDMPFVNTQLVQYMLNNANGYDIVVPRVDKKLHPLFGIYSKNLITNIEGLLKQDSLKVSHIFTKAKTRFILKDEIEKFDQGLLTLVNINTQGDWQRLKKCSRILTEEL